MSLDCFSDDHKLWVTALEREDDHDESSFHISSHQPNLFIGWRKKVAINESGFYLPTYLLVRLLDPIRYNGRGSAWTGGISDKSEFMQIEIKRNFDPFM